MEKICPLMSKGDNIVKCNRDCMWFEPDGQFAHQCAIFRIIDGIDFIADMIHISHLPSEDDE